MSVKNIITTPDPKLDVICEKIEQFDQETKKLADDLLDTVMAAKDPEGAGLAAPQIGVTKSMCVVRKFYDNKENNKNSTIIDYVLINPQIIKTSKETDTDWEACLSVPEKYGKVIRPKKIKLTYFDLSGKKNQLNASGFFARVILHEIDHLNGVLFTQRVIGRVINEEEFLKLQSEYSY